MTQWVEKDKGARWYRLVSSKDRVFMIRDGVTETENPSEVSDSYNRLFFAAINRSVWLGQRMRESEPSDTPMK